MESSAMENQERRRYGRFPIDVPIRVSRMGTKGVPQVYLGRGTNMGKGGIQALVATELHLHEHIRIEVTLPYSSQLLKLEAEVRNRSGYNYGLQFLPMGSAEVAQIERVCSVLALMFDTPEPARNREP